MAITHSIRQGHGTIHTFTGTAPTTRADGTPLGLNEISHYVRTVTGPTGVEEMDVMLTAGSFSEPLAVDVLMPGIYTITMRTVDTDGRQSVESEVVTMEILAPLAPPNPPTMLS